MIVTVASHKGGVGKTTTAFHLAAYFQTLAPTLLLDGDETRNATAWCKRGSGVSFKVADEVQAAKLPGTLPTLSSTPASGLNR
jgi:chromosome partitioning protein